MQNFVRKNPIITLLVLALVPIAFGIKMNVPPKKTKHFMSSQKLIEDSNVYSKLFSKFLENNTFQQQFTENNSVSQKILRDPFRTPNRKTFAVTKAGEKVKRPALSLKGILWDGKKSSAVINRKIFREGSKIGRYTISKITREKVFLVSQNDHYALRLPLNKKHNF